MTPRLSAVLLLPLFLPAAATCGEDATKELAKLRGIWAVEAMEHHGNPTLFGVKPVGKGGVSFAGDKMSLEGFERGKLPKPAGGEEFFLPEFTVTGTANVPFFHFSPRRSTHARQAVTCVNPCQAVPFVGAFMAVAAWPSCPFSAASPGSTMASDSATGSRPLAAWPRDPRRVKRPAAWAARPRD